MTSMAHHAIQRPVDAVLLWVDGDDPAWRREFDAARQRESSDASPIRYRDWETLRYWFRAVERFAPWLRTVHFITWGHLPPWLDTSHPRLHVVDHRDYIPADYLPTFNSNVIELNIHRIGGLPERFVLFNDDTFLCRPCREEDFFRGGVPCDMARLSVVQPSSVAHTVYNCLTLVNALHDKRSVIRRHPGKWFSPRYGVANLLKSLTLMPWSTIPGLLDPHMPQPYLRRQFERAWELWGPQLDATCRHPFRDLGDLSHWLVRYDGLCRGEFAPHGMGDCRTMTLGDADIETTARQIESQRYRMICLHDSAAIADFDRVRDRLVEAFERILPEKSSYERR